MNWLKQGRTDAFRYVLVEWPTFKELRELQGITDCTITDNALTSLKSSGKLGYARKPDVGDHMVRVYSDSVLGGERKTVCHGTFFATTPSSTWTGAGETGTAEMFSVLWVLQQNKVQGSFTAAKGTNAVKLATQLARGYGNNLKVAATPSDRKVKTSHTWDAGTTFLEIVNWLLDFAGYEEADVDAYGNVLMRPYVAPARKSAVATFSDARDSVSEPSFSRELDAYEVPNKVVCICSNADEKPMVAKAVNADPNSPYSTVSRKKTIVRVEKVSDIESKAALQRKARNLLAESTSVVESIEVSHSYQPFRVGDAVQMDYESAGYSRKLVAVSCEKKMVPGIRCKTKARRYVNL